MVAVPQIAGKHPGQLPQVRSEPDIPGHSPTLVVTTTATDTKPVPHHQHDAAEPAAVDAGHGDDHITCPDSVNGRSITVTGSAHGLKPGEKLWLFDHDVPTDGYTETANSRTGTVPGRPS
jgi:hypothetical protein